MRQYLITFHTLTQAQRASRLLERSGYTVTLRRTPQNLRQSGCGYALALRRDVWEACELLKQNGLWTGKLFSREDGGEYREVRP